VLLVERGCEDFREKHRSRAPDGNYRLDAHLTKAGRKGVVAPVQFPVLWHAKLTIRYILLTVAYQPCALLSRSRSAVDASPARSCARLDSTRVSNAAQDGKRGHFMGVWFSQLLNIFGDREARILVLGLDNAGVLFPMPVHIPSKRLLM
jgi:hypothetical protein